MNNKEMDVLWYGIHVVFFGGVAVASFLSGTMGNFYNIMEYTFVFYGVGMFFYIPIILWRKHGEDKRRLG